MASSMPPLSPSASSLRCISRLEESLLAPCTVSGNSSQCGPRWRHRRVLVSKKKSQQANLCQFGATVRPVAAVTDEGPEALESLIESDVLEQVFQAPRSRVAPLVGKKGWRLERPGQLKIDSLVPQDWKPVQLELNRPDKAKKREYIDDLVRAAEQKEARKRSLVKGQEHVRRKVVMYGQQDEVVRRTFLPQSESPWTSRHATATSPEVSGTFSNSTMEKPEAAKSDYDSDTESDGDEDDFLGQHLITATDDENRFPRGSTLTSGTEDDSDMSDDESGVQRADEGEDVSEPTVDDTMTSVRRAKPRDPFARLGGRSFADVVKSLQMDDGGEGKGPLQQPPGRLQTGVDLDSVKAMFRKRPANFLRTCSDKWKLLHTISASWEKSINLPLLLKFDLDKDELDMDGMTALHRAVCNGRRVTAKYLVEAGADACVTDKDGATLLHYAARAGVPDVARDLLKVRLDPNATDEDGWTPLHVAVQSGRRDMVKRFLTYGAEANIENKEGRTAVDLAIAYAKAFDFYEVVKLFQLSSEQRASLEHAPTPPERDEYLDQWRNYGSTVPAKWMPLHTLAASGNLFHMCDLLRQEGNNLNAVDKDGETALRKAVVYGKPTSAKHLIEAGADPFVQDSHGATLLHYAAQNGFLDNIKKLTKRGVFVNSPDDDLWTPLHVAVLGGRKDTILCLMNRGADRYCRNRDGNMVLDIAASFGRKFGYYQVAKVISKTQYKKIEAKLASEDDAEGIATFSREPV